MYLEFVDKKEYTLDLGCAYSGDMRTELTVRKEKALWILGLQRTQLQWGIISGPLRHKFSHLVRALASMWSLLV